MSRKVLIFGALLVAALGPLNPGTTIAAGIQIVRGIEGSGGAAGITVQRGLSGQSRGLAGHRAAANVRVYRGGGDHPDAQSNRVFEDPGIARVLRGLVDNRKFEPPPKPRIRASVRVEAADPMQIQRQLKRRAAIKLHRAGFVEKSLIIVHRAGVTGGRNIIVHRAGRFEPTLIRTATSLDRACPVNGSKMRRRDDGRFCGVIIVHRTGFKDKSRIRLHRAGFR